jgi:hypothetical protein
MPPSNTHSFSPSHSSQPSSVPSIGPSNSSPPSDGPSEEPSLSNDPSFVGSNSPSFSTVPSHQPSGSPTRQSLQPSKVQSAIPSLSNRPSLSPSIPPTSSSVPSNTPSNRPSLTFQPSTSPSYVPSSSMAPSSFLSESPSDSLQPTERLSVPSETNLPSTSPSKSCMNVVVDFETDGEGNTLSGGLYVKEQWFAAYGMTITASSFDAYTPGDMPRLFDSSHPWTRYGIEDPDLGSPNEKCQAGGPGEGKGGRPGQPGENCEPLGNVLVIQKTNTTASNDNSRGGMITFHFKFPVAELIAIGFIDLEGKSLDLDQGDEDASQDDGLPDAILQICSSNGEVTSRKVAGTGNNGVLTKQLGFENVTTIQVVLEGTGAITFLSMCLDTASVRPNGELSSSSSSSSVEPTSAESLAPSLSQAPTFRPSGLPSVSERPSSLPSAIPSRSGQPSMLPTDRPSQSALPSSSPSLVPTVSALPSTTSSHIPSISSGPSKTPSSKPSVSTKPSAHPSYFPTGTLLPSVEPSHIPSTSVSPSVGSSESPSQSLFPSSSPSGSPSRTIPPSNRESDGPSLSSEPTGAATSLSQSPTTGLTSLPPISERPSVHQSLMPIDSGHPSTLPTHEPSQSAPPSNSPTSSPTSSTWPSILPTDSPSNLSYHPSPSPSVDPSQRPTNRPSGLPSTIERPTVQPSAISTMSVEPSVFPAQEPSQSALPSVSPSSMPSESQRPSELPTNTPSQSLTPSAAFSTTPTGSSIPSLLPSNGPSSSLLPSTQPTDSPIMSGVPSQNPSGRPSVSQSPSEGPSSSPSESPSPSSTPSSIPSNSATPSVSPSNVPSSSVSPSASPSLMPSVLASHTVSSNSSPSASTSQMCTKVTLDFSTTGSGTTLVGGEYVKDEWLKKYGLSITASPAGDGVAPNGYARIFDTENGKSTTSGGSPLIRSPHRYCGSDGKPWVDNGSPGRGIKGRPNHRGENCQKLGNALIIQDLNSSVTDANPGGGILSFHFDPPVAYFESLAFLNMAADDAISLFTAGSAAFRTISVHGYGPGSFQIVNITESNVSKISVNVTTIRAVTHLRFCVFDNLQPAPPLPPVIDPWPTRRILDDASRAGILSDLNEKIKREKMALGLFPAAELDDYDECGMDKQSYIHRIPVDNCTVPDFDGPIQIVSQEADSVTFTIRQRWSDCPTSQIPAGSHASWVATDYVGLDNEIRCDTLRGMACGDAATYTALCGNGGTVVDVYTFDESGTLSQSDGTRLMPPLACHVPKAIDLTKICHFRYLIRCASAKCAGQRSSRYLKG